MGQCFCCCSTLWITAPAPRRPNRRAIDEWRGAFDERAMRSHCVRMLNRCVRMLRAGNRLLLAGARLTEHSMSAQEATSKPLRKGFPEGFREGLRQPRRLRAPIGQHHGDRASRRPGRRGAGRSLRHAAALAARRLHGGDPGTARPRPSASRNRGGSGGVGPLGNHRSAAQVSKGMRLVARARYSKRSCMAASGLVWVKGHPERAVGAVNGRGLGSGPSARRVGFSRLVLRRRSSVPSEARSIAAISAAASSCAWSKR
ncbi:hypothetical protein XTPLMG728_3219 [Xanthomonas translucens pv. poae]|uniref:Uncharacterized protein n=1 Tax=Xanthomonas graminis pv. poae TaxID=227946 RepID=A0A0K3A779_9XANT|nr:hypothetical protein XTPLMG728_3219 [Xanthomonas translucens pv. poae]